MRLIREDMQHGLLVESRYGSKILSQRRGNPVSLHKEDA